MAAMKAEPVCAEPKVFVGQLPDEASQADVQALFQQYGAISDCSLIKGPDGRGRGFAMVQFQKWRDAEAAIEHLNGTTSLGGNRTLVVKVADPPKRGGAAVGGIAPKKLFVGQVPTDTDEAQLRTLFEQYGFIKDMHLVRKAQPWFAFVTFDKWAEAEMAVEALNGQTTLPNARSPLVVKFADGKPMEGGLMGAGGRSGGEKRALGADEGVPQKRQFMGSDGGGMMNGFGMMGFNPAAVMGGMGNARMMGRMGGMGSMGGMGGMNPMGLGAMGMGAMGGLGMGAMGMGNGMGGYGMGGMPPMSAGMSPMQMPGGGMGSPQQMRNGGGRMGVGPPGGPNTVARQWKLFVGQVPFEANEQDLWQLFGPLGEIVELVVLRHPGSGKSRGCAFVTYVAKECAQMAIDTIHEQQALPGRDKVLVVKYANN